MPRLNWFDWIAFVLVIIGSLFWGLVGIIGEPILTAMAAWEATIPGLLIAFRIVWLLVGLAGLWIIWSLYKLSVPAMRERMAAS